MSTQPAPTTPPGPSGSNEIKLYSHSSIVYWWPVWVVGFILGIMTRFSGERIVVVPGDAETSRNWEVKVGDRKTETREGVLLPADSKKHLAPADKEGLKEKPELKLHGSSNKNYGVLFAIVLLLVIFITNVPLRGMWSVLIIIMVIMLSVIFALADIWDKILAALSLLDIRINTGGYFFISTGLLILWLF